MSSSSLISKVFSLCLFTATLSCAWGQHGGNRGPGPGGGMGDHGGMRGPGASPRGTPLPNRDGAVALSLPLPGSKAGEPNNPATRSGLQLGPVGRWWDDRGVAETIGLRKDQRKRMDSIFNANKPALIESYQALEREQNKLSSLSQAQQLDKTRMFQSIDAVNQARAALEKANTEMILQLRQALDADQLQKLERLR